MPPTPTVVVPISVLKQETVSETLAEFLAPVPVLVVGLVDIPDQTSSEQARTQFEDEARETLDTLTEMFVATGSDVETRLSFTHNPQSTLEQVVTDLDRAAVLVPAPLTQSKRLLVAVRGEINVPGIVSTVASLVDSRDTTVTVYHGTSQDDTAESERMLSGVTRALEEAGLDPARITTTIERTETPLDSLVETANEYDLLVIGEDKPKLVDRIFGDTSRRVATQAAVPVLIVRRPPME